MKWRDDSCQVLECFCGFHIDVGGMDVTDLSDLFREHCKAAEGHVWTEPQLARLIGQQWGMFVDENGEFWKHTSVGWEWVCRPKRAP